MELEEGLKGKIIYNSIVAFIFIILGLAVFSLKGHVGYDTGYVNYYAPLLFIGAGIIFVLGVFVPLIRNNPTTEVLLNAGDLNDPEEYKPLGMPETPFWLRVLPHIFFAVMVGIMIMNVPAVSKGFYTMPEVLSSSSSSQTAESFYISVPVGLAEDFWYSYLLPGIFLALIIAILTLGFGIQVTWKQYLALVLIVCFITTAGYGALFPGFASTHELAFKDDMPKYTYVFAIGYVQSSLNMITGLYLPVSHVTNNYLVSQSYQGNKVGGSITPTGG